MLTPRTLLGLALVLGAGILAIRLTIAAFITGLALWAEDEGPVAVGAGCGGGSAMALVAYFVVYLGLRLAEIVQ